MSFEELVDQAKSGSRQALEQLITAIQDDVYRLAVRMLWHPHDAEDAAQEILIRVLTNLSGYRGAAAFRTWVFRIASNYLLTTRKRRMEQRAVSFDEFAADLADGLSDEWPRGCNEAEQQLLVREVKIGCTQAMLMCLDRDHRLAYILGEIMELSSDDAAAILEITPAAFRKRLSRSRERVRGFLEGHCGLVNSDAACRCYRRVRRAVELGRVDRQQLLFAEHPAAPTEALEYQVAQLDALRHSAALHRSNPQFLAPSRLRKSLEALLDTTMIPPPTDNT